MPTPPCFIEKKTEMREGEKGGEGEEERTNLTSGSVVV